MESWASSPNPSPRGQRAPQPSVPPFLVIAEADGGRTIVPLASEAERITVGRRSAADVALTADDEVSRLHAELVRVDSEWTLVDDGLSANGSYVNDQRVYGRRRLRDGDVLRFGQTTVVFRRPRDTDTPTTVHSDLGTVPLRITDTQHRILVALCRPFKERAEFATPATNDEIAREVYLSVDAVKKHLRVLSARFGVGQLRPQEKRLRLAERALAAGVVARSEL